MVWTRQANRRDLRMTGAGECPGKRKKVPMRFGTTTALVFLGTLAAFINGCSTGITENADVGESAGLDSQSLEQKLDLVPQMLQAADVDQKAKSLDVTIPRYVILSQETGTLDLGSISLTSDIDGEKSLPEVFQVPSEAQAALQDRDALLLVSVPEQDAETLCKRFQFSYRGEDVEFDKDERLVYGTQAKDGRVSALCFMPKVVSKGNAGKEKGSSEANVGAGSYTLKVERLLCNNPRDWENLGYNGDEARMRAFYDGIGTGEIWRSDNVKSGKNYYPNRYVHFTSNATLELYDYDSAPWNASDLLGVVAISTGDVCKPTPIVPNGHFDGSGSGHDWNYDLWYKVYGPNCKCQNNEPQVLKSYTAETCSVTSSTITSYTYYCSGGIYYRQAWGNQTRFCETKNNTYNESCELKTFVSSSLVEQCTHYDTGVAIGAPQNYGSCQTDPCLPQVSGESVIPPEQSLVIDPTCPL